MRLLILFLFSFMQCFAAQEQEEKREAIVLPVGEVHRGDFFAMGHSVEISGVVTGDAYIFASQIFIDGTVKGDLLAIGGSIEISGNLQNNIRVIGGQVMINGKIAQNGTVIAGNVQTTSSSETSGNVVCIAGNADLAGVIGSDLTLLASNGRLVGKVMGDLAAIVGQMRLTSRAFVGKNFEYTSNSEAWIDKGAQVMGKTIHQPSFFQGLFKGRLLKIFLLGTRFAVVLMNFLYSFFIGYLLIRYFPENLHKALANLSHHPVKSFGVGVLMLIFLPLASLLLLMTILGVPFALTLIALNVIGFYTAKTYSIIWVSNSVFMKIGLKPNKVWTFCLGLIVYFLLTGIPILGIIIALTAMIFGIGAAVIAQTPKKFFQQ